MNKRAREVYDLLKRYRNGISLNEIYSANPVLAHTFRNGVSELRKLGADIKWVAKVKEYRMIREPFVEDNSGQRAFL